MESEGSLPCSQELACLRPCVTLCNKLVSYSKELIAPHPNPKLEDPLISYL